MDHILYPTLTDSQFITEVYHLDGEASKKGVVYCEMSALENEDGFISSLEINRLLFQNATTYSYECGGLTKDIQTLTNKEIIDYHKDFYHINNMAIIICGSVDPQKCFEKLESLPSLLEQPSNTTPKSQLIVPPKLPFIPSKLISSRIPFPSADEEVGSVVFGWRGPPKSDFETSVSLDILARFLHDTSTSPLSQAFVEIKDPIASDVSADIGTQLDSALTICFSGVPFDKDTGEDGSSSEGASVDNESEMSENGIGGDEMSVDGEPIPRGYYFEEGRLHGLVIDCLKDVRDRIFEDPGTVERMKATIKRHRRKILESLEEDPHENLYGYLVGDLVRFHFGTRDNGGEHTKLMGGKPFIGTWAQVFGKLDALETKPLKFWKSLLNTYFLEQVCCEVRMTPSKELAEKNQNADLEEQDRLKNFFGEHGLEKIRSDVSKAIKENEINLTKEQMKQMPIPDASKAAKLESHSELINLDTSIPTRQVSCLQVVHTETSFAQFRIFLRLTELPDHLKPYLVLFQSLLFETSILSPDQKTIIDYKDLVTETSSLLISNESAIGLGNETFHTSWLSETFILGGSSDHEKWSEMIAHLLKVLFRSVFMEERVESICKNLISEVVEVKRSGSALLTSVSTRISVPRTNEMGWNDLEISVFKQEEVLNEVLELIKDGKAEKILDKLKEIQSFLIVRGIEDKRNFGFVQLAIPMAYKDHTPTSTISETFNRLWDLEVSSFQQRTTTVESKPVSKKSKPNASSSIEISLFPFPRLPFSLSDIDPSFGEHVLVAIPGLNSSYLHQIVECDAFGEKNHIEVHAITLLCDLLSRTEGPLYTGIRGKGLAYGCGLFYSQWTGQLGMDVSRSSDPRKALLVYYDMLLYMQTEKGFDDLVSDFHVDTARATRAFSTSFAKSTSSGLIGSILRSTLRGFKSIEEEEKFQTLLYSVTKKDIRVVFEKRMTVCTTVAGDAAQTLVEGFRGLPIKDEMPYSAERWNQLEFNDCRVDMKNVLLTDFKL